MNTNLLYEKLTVVMPAFNEEKTVAEVIAEVLKLNLISELILVNDGSTDGTDAKIQKFKKDSRFVYIKHPRNKGKGAALKSGIKKSKNEIILLLDADLKNITVAKLQKIVLPVMKGEVDVSRAGFRLTRGRVTEIAVKPMMRILFPDVYFNQPISGQVCAHKEFLENVDLESGWGVDIGILLDAIQSGQRIVEVDIGNLEHKARSDKEKAEMAEQVMETMIKKAGLIQHKYKIVIFALDDTLINQNSFRELFESLGIRKKFDKIKHDFLNNEISYKEYADSYSALFKGLSKSFVDEACSRVSYVRYAPEIISLLKKRKYQVAVISSNFSAIVEPIAHSLGIDLVDCAYLEEKSGVYTGNITAKSREKWISQDLGPAFEQSFLRIIAKEKAKPLQAIMVAHSPKFIEIFQKIGLAIAYRPNDLHLREVSDKTISILPEILAIVE